MTPLEQKLLTALDAEQNAREKEQIALLELLNVLIVEQKAIHDQNELILQSLNKPSEGEDLKTILKELFEEQSKSQTASNLLLTEGIAQSNSLLIAEISKLLK